MTRASVFLHRYALCVAAATLVLLAAGGLVTSTESGLSVPDWPLSYGQFFPPMVGGVRFEHSHRLIAAVVGFLTLGLAVAVVLREPRRWVRGLAVGAFAAVLIQALLGGLTVLYHLPMPVSVTHATVGPLFFTLMAVLALVLSPAWKTPPAPGMAGAARLRLWTRLAAAAVLLQLVLGAYVRHSGGNGIIVHMCAAVLLTAAVLAAAFIVFARFQSHKGLVRAAAVLLGLLTAQIFLGLITFHYTHVFEKLSQPRLGEVIFATVHQTAGAVMLMASVLTALYVHRFFRE